VLDKVDNKVIIRRYMERDNCIKENIKIKFKKFKRVKKKKRYLIKDGMEKKIMGDRKLILKVM
jgi:hypothetical protein